MPEALPEGSANIAMWNFTRHDDLRHCGAFTRAIFYMDPQVMVALIVACDDAMRVDTEIIRVDQIFAGLIHEVMIVPATD